MFNLKIRFLYHFWSQSVTVFKKKKKACKSTYQGINLHIVIPSTSPDGYTVTGIDDRAFLDCEMISSIGLPDTVKYIGDYAFSGCSYLSFINLPDGLESIGECAFRWCELVNVTIPDSVTSIGSGAFLYCTLDMIILGSGLTYISGDMFGGSGLVAVVITDSVTRIANFAFASCDSLKYVYYTGSEADWQQIEIGDANSPLTNATFYYNYSA